MTLIIFVIILGVLVLVHELGHFIFAKKAGVKVEEFGFGYPPRALTLGEKWGTKFSLNWIPFGGFVKIFGENYEEGAETDESSQAREFSAENSLSVDASRVHKPFDNSPVSAKGNLKFADVSKKWQALILFGGVLFNIIFAWLLFSLSLISGTPTPVENNFGATVRDPKLTIISVLPESPASKAGLKSGDRIIAVENGESSVPELGPESVAKFVNASAEPLDIKIERGEKVLNFEVLPDTSLMEGRKIIGINMDMVGTLSLPVHKALVEGARTTVELTSLTVKGILGLIAGAFVGTADLSQVTGPIGIVGLVGDASRLGLVYLATFTALISINLAVVNLLPFPALDGGRLVFVVIEALTRRRIPAKVGAYVNGIGFTVLILLMLVITFKDIKNLF